MMNYSEIRLLSLHQPWASLIAAGIKQIETRHWQTPYRGLIAIHAAKRRIDDNGLKLLSNVATNLHTLPLGAIVAVATLTDCSIMAEENGQPYCYLRDGAGEKFYPSETESACGFWSSGRYAWQLKDVRAIEPIYTKGMQGLPVIRDAAVLEALAGVKL
jgi:hypothetical protein